MLAIVIVADLCLEPFATSNLGLLRPSSDPELLFELKRGTYHWNGLWLHGHDTLYSVDDNGCRVPAAGAPQHVDVVLVGGMVGFGMGVPEEETVGGLLEPRLKDLGASATVANCSVPGHRLLALLHNAELEVLRRHPRTVILMLEPNDVETPYDFSKLFNPESAPASWLYDHSGLFRLVYRGSQMRQQLRKDAPVDGRELEARLARFSSVMKENGVRPFVVLLNSTSEGYAELLEDAAARQSISVVSVPIVRQGAWDRKNYVEVADALARTVTGGEVAGAETRGTTAAGMPAQVRTSPPAPPTGMEPKERIQNTAAVPAGETQTPGKPPTAPPPNAALAGGAQASGEPPAEAPRAGASQKAPGKP